MVATSGDATSSGAASQTTLANAQVAGVTTGGGPAAATAANKASGSVVDVGVADSQSGAAVAVPGDSSSNTTAKSGSAAAGGVNAQNVVSNQALASVQVGGANQAEISGESDHQTTIGDVGIGLASTGDALVNYPQASVGTNSSTATGPRSDSVSTTGLTSDTSVAGSLSSTTVVQAGVASTSTASNLLTNAPAGAVEQSIQSTGGSGPAPVGPTDPISVQQVQQVTLEGGAGAIAASAAACGGTACGSAGYAKKGSSPAGDVEAASGAAQAIGLEAQNVVETNGLASVKVKGQNFGLITVIIQSVTNILNGGGGLAESGQASAVEATTGKSSKSYQVTTPDGNGPVDTAVQSGSAAATGANISNQVELRSEAQVKVEGDNYNPITVLVKLAATLTNWGWAEASSGDASAGAARRPSAEESAAGTKAASGSASATGLQVKNQVNLGGLATVEVTGSNYAPITVQIQFITDIYNQGVAVASSGAAQAGGQYGSASRGSSQPIVGVRSRRTTIERGLLQAQSGAAASQGNASSVVVVNYQVASVANPGGPSVSKNEASFSIASSGEASAVSGLAFSGPPPPPPIQKPPADPPGYDYPPVYYYPPIYYYPRTTLPVYGNLLLDEYPVYAAAPLPGWGLWPPQPQPAPPPGTRVRVDTNFVWPGGQPLPMPLPPSAVRSSGAEWSWPSSTLQGMPGQRAPLRRPGVGPGETAGSTFAVDPWSVWPSPQGLAMPDQRVKALAVGSQGLAGESLLTRRPRALSPEDLAASLAAGGLAIAGLWRRRVFLLALALQTLVGLRTAVVLLPRLWCLSIVRLWSLGLLVGLGLAALLQF
jgi:hypothetical protein